jgi:hypothetical protein
MNIRTKLILATTAIALLSTPALAFRDLGDAGGDSAFAHSGGHSSAYTVHRRYRVGHRHRSHHLRSPRASGLRGRAPRGHVWGHWGTYYGPMISVP